MAKNRVRISLATKFRVLFAGAAVAILGATLSAAWYLSERLADHTTEQSVEAVSNIYLREWEARHQEKPLPPSAVAARFAPDAHGRRGPTMLPLTPTATAPAADDLVRLAEKSFRQDSHAKMLVFAQRDDRGEQVYRVLRAVRASGNCREAINDLHQRTGRLLGQVLLAGGLASVIFYVIMMRQIILLRRLRHSGPVDRSL